MTRPSLTATVGRNVASYFVARAIEAVLLLVALPLVVQGLGPERYGLFSLGLIGLLYLGFIEAGLAQAQVALMSESRARGDTSALEGLAGSGLAIYTGAALAGGAALAIAAPLAARIFQVPEDLAPEATRIFRMVGGFFALLLFQSPFRALLVSFHRVSVVNGALLAGSVLKYPAMLAVLKLDGRLVPVFAAYVAGGVVELAIVTAGAARLLKSAALRPRWDTAGARALLRFGAVTSTSTLTIALLLHLDKVAIGLYLPVAVVGVYHVAYSLAARLVEIPRAVVGAVPPALAELAGSGQPERLARAYRRVFKLLLGAPLHLAVLLALGAPGLLEAWVGPEIARGGAGVLRILSAAFLLACLTHAPYMLANAAGAPGVPARIRTLLLLPGAALVFVLTLRLGLEGAALAVLGVMTADFVLMAVWVHRRTRVPFPFEACWKPLVLSAAVGGLTWPVLGHLRGLPAWLSVLGLSYALYLAGTFAWAADPEERALLVKPKVLR